MLSGKKITCIIPARLNSQRLNKKILLDIGGKPLIQRVYESASSCSIFDRVIIAIDDSETEDIVKTFTSSYIMTPELSSGTQRLIFVQNNLNLNADIFVNWQADEPFITEEVIKELLPSDNLDEDIWTLKKEISLEKDILNPNNVKVVTDSSNRALYFSRAPIPFEREKNHSPFYKHIGIYAFSKNALKQIKENQMSSLEKTEKLEQLSFLFHGLKIYVAETQGNIFGIDTKDDLDKANSLFSSKK